MEEFNDGQILNIKRTKSASIQRKKRKKLKKINSNLNISNEEKHRLRKLCADRAKKTSMF